MIAFTSLVFYQYSILDIAIGILLSKDARCVPDMSHGSMPVKRIRKSKSNRDLSIHVVTEHSYGYCVAKYSQLAA